MIINRIPHLADPGTRCVDDRDLPLLEQLQLLDRGAERGQNHDVAFLDAGEVLRDALVL